MRQLSRTYYFADFIVEECVVVEVKAVAKTTETDRRQLQTYLEIASCPLGLLINFGARTLVDGVTRVVNHFPEDAGHTATEA